MLLPGHAAAKTLTVRTQVWQGAVWTYVPAPDTLTPAYYEWQGGTYTYAPARVIGGGVRHPVNTGRPFSEVEQ
jgi:hypothetical protein